MTKYILKFQFLLFKYNKNLSKTRSNQQTQFNVKSDGNNHTQTSIMENKNTRNCTIVLLCVSAVLLYIASWMLSTLSSNSFPLHRIILSNGTENSFLLLFILKWSISAHLNTNGKLDEFYNRKLFLSSSSSHPFLFLFLPTLKSVCFLCLKGECMKKFSRTLSSSSRHCSFHAVNWFIK